MRMKLGASLALVAAVLATYLVEKPGSKLFDLCRDGLAHRRALRAAADPGAPDGLPGEAFEDPAEDGTERKEKKNSV